jgi:hypothetical protein
MVTLHSTEESVQGKKIESQMTPAFVAQNPIESNDICNCDLDDLVSRMQTVSWVYQDENATTTTTTTARCPPTIKLRNALTLNNILIR